MSMFPQSPTDRPNASEDGFEQRADDIAIEVSVVMPCLNEAETLSGCIAEAQQALTDAGLRGEIVIADNGSTDGSQQIALEMGARGIGVGEKGYGNALRGGIEASRGELIVMADADASYDFSHTPRFVAKLREGFDLVMGNRFAGGIEPGAMPWKHRYIGNPVLSGIGRLFFHCPANDFHCGLRGFRRTAYEQMELNTTGMEFASEMVIKATLKGMRVTEIPTVLRPDGRSRRPHLQSWRDGWRHLRFMLLFCPRWLFLIPGLAAAGTGLVLLTVIASQGTWWIGEVGLSTNTAMAAAMMVILGTQVLFCGVFARHLSVLTGNLPANRIMSFLKGRVSLEIGVVAGMLVSLCGLVLLGSALWTWRTANFGELDLDLTHQRVIPSVTLTIIGTQTVFASFLLSLMRFCFANERRSVPMIAEESR